MGDSLSTLFFHVQNHMLTQVCSVVSHAILTDSARSFVHLFIHFVCWGAFYYKCIDLSDGVLAVCTKEGL